MRVTRTLSACEGELEKVGEAGGGACGVNSVVARAPLPIPCPPCGSLWKNAFVSSMLEDFENNVEEREEGWKGRAEREEGSDCRDVKERAEKLQFC